jgi:hypothetical protein
MATRSWTKVYESYYDVFIWTTTLSSGDDTDALLVPRHNDISVQCTGTFGAAVAIKGANHPTTPVYVTLKDALGNDCSFTANTPPTQILPGSYQIKAEAGAITSVVVTVKVKR